MTTRTLSTTAAGVFFIVLNAAPAWADDTRNFSGLASHYGKNYKGVTAAGQPYDPDKFTAAHRTLPFGTRLRVTDPKTRRSVTVVVNDRGPFIEGRVLDLSMAAARELDMVERGIARVTVVRER